MVLLLLMLVAPLTLQADNHVEVVRAFDESPAYLPEGVTMEVDGNMYVSLGPPFFVGGGYGALVQVSPDGTETVLVEYPEGPALAGLTVDAQGGVYFALPNPGQPDVGVYRLTDEEAERIPGTENMLVPNGLAFDNEGNLYATDSILGSIFRMSPDGSSEAELWISHELLMGCSEEDAVGANGIALWEGGFYVANTANGLLLFVPMLEDGSAGEPEVIAGDPECTPGEDLYAMDGIALDEAGNVYALLVLQHKLVVIDPEDGTHELLLDEDDGLWNGASLVFGTLPENRESLFIANYAVLPPEPENSLGPAVLKFEVGTPGLTQP
jgi:sugar lactone lactonase YvrE